VGIGLVSFIGYTIFDTPRISTMLSEGNWLGAVIAFRRALNQPSGLLWAYLLLTVANAMMPSASDREPLMPVLFYSGLAIIAYIILGLPLQGAAAMMQWLAPTLSNLSSALLFVIVLDIIILSVLYLVRLIISR
jgi:hypothetical protein